MQQYDDHHYLVPQHEKGLRADFESRVIAETLEDAEDDFVDAKEQLLDVNNWGTYSAALNIAFSLTDHNGKAVDRAAHKGDYIRINIYGKEGAANSPGWAHIEAIEYDDYPDVGMETMAMRLRPCDEPQHKDEGTDQLNKEATSTFVIERRGKILLSTYHGRNSEDDDSVQWHEAVAAAVVMQ